MNVNKEQEIKRNELGTRDKFLINKKEARFNPRYKNRFICLPFNKV